MLLALIVANWAVYAWTAVEMRFGSVLLLVLFPLAAYAALRIAASRSSGGRRGWSRSAWRATSSSRCSFPDWVRDQSPLIRETRLSRAEPVGSTRGRFRMLRSSNGRRRRGGRARRLA